MDDYYTCQCNAMHLDIDAGRFASNYGDENILRYEKLPEGVVDALTSLAEGDTLEVIREFKDFDGKDYPVGFEFLRFKQYNCVPYHGGYTFSFENTNLRMCDLEPANCEVMFHAEQFFRVKGNPLDPPKMTAPPKATGSFLERLRLLFWPGR